MNPMVEWHGDPDDGTPYVLASDYDELERDRAELIEALRSLLVALVKTGDNARVEHGQNAAFMAARALLSRLEKDKP